MDTATSPAGKPPQALSGHCVVDSDFAVVLEERFGIPTAFILRALEGEPHQPAIALCRWAIRHEEPNGTLLVRAREHKLGRAPARARGGISPPLRGPPQPRRGVRHPSP
jgi:hypothetical protein